MEKEKAVCSLSISKMPWPWSSYYYYKLAELAQSQDEDNLAWSQNGWLFSHSSLSFVACGCDKHFYHPNFQNLSWIKHIYASVGGGSPRGDLPCIVCLEKDTTPCLSSYKSLAAPSSYFMRQMKNWCMFLFWVFFSFDIWVDPGKKELSWHKDAQDCSPLGALRLMEAFLWVFSRKWARTAVQPVQTSRLERFYL